MIALPPDIAVSIPEFSEAGLEALADLLLDSMESSCGRDLGVRTSSSRTDRTTRRRCAVRMDDDRMEVT